MKKKQWIICAIVLSVIVLGVAGYFLIDLFTPNVGLCLVGEDSQYGIVQTALEKAGFTVLTDAGESQEKQISALVQAGVDLIIVQAADPSDVSGILEKAGETPVLFIGNAPENLSGSYLAGYDPKQLGAMQAALLVDYFAKADVNGDKLVEYMLLSGSDKDGYFQGANEAAEGYKTIKLEEAVCDGTIEGAKALCKQAFSKYGRDLELIFCSSGELARGAVAAIRESGRTAGRDVVVFGAGTAAQCQEYVRTGAITAAIVEDEEALCDEIVRVTRALLSGREVAQENYVSYKLLTHENVDN